MVFGILYPLGLAALLSIIPLIIIYLVRPKPRQEVIPSLMFLMRRKGRTKKQSFLQRFISNLLLYLQILVLVFVAISLAQPFITVPEANVLGDSVIIIDASGSMGTGNRFEQARQFAYSQISDTTTIILAKNNPEVILQRGSAADAQAILNNIKPSGTTTNLFDAIKISENFLENRGKISVISDFIDTSSPDSFETAIRTLRSRGNVVNIKNVFSRASNVGIVDLIVNPDKSTVTLKNYDDKERTFNLIVVDKSQEVVLVPGGIKSFDFNTPLGKSTVKIDVQDDFQLDNQVYMSTPENRRTRVLLINSQEDKYITIALEENEQIQLEKVSPLSVDKFDYDVIIIGNVDSDKILSGTIQSIKERVQQGFGAIVLANEESDKIDYKELVDVGDGLLEDTIVGSNSLTRDIIFGKSKFFSGDGMPLAVSPSNHTVISYKTIGNGRVLYYGILDQFSGFKFDLNYPVFWKNVVNFVLNRKDISELNTKSGKILTFENPVNVATPSGQEESDTISLDDLGFYGFGPYTMSSNMLDLRESDVNNENNIEESLEEVMGSKKDVPFEISYIILILIVALVIFEVIYVKYRGDI